MFREAIARKDPVLFVVSTIDREHADFDAAYQSIKDRLTAKVVPVEIPIGAGAGFKGVINLFTKRAHLFKPGTKAGEYEEADIPASEQARFERYHQEMVEAVAATDDALLERFFGGEELPGELAMSAMKEAMKRQDIFPLLCCSSQLTWGVRTVLDFLVSLMPSAFEMEELHAFKGAEGERTVEIHPAEDAPFTALVFKTTAEPHVGDVSYFRTFSGTVAARAGGLQRHARFGRKADAPLDSARTRAHRGAAAVSRRHRLRREAAQHAHQRHAVDEGASGAHAADPVPGSDRHVRGEGHVAERRRETAAGPAPAARRRPDVPDAFQHRDARDDRRRDGRAAHRSRAGAPRAAVRREGGPFGAAHPVSRDDHGEGRRAGPAQEAVRREAASSATAGSDQARPARQRLPVRRRNRRRCPFRATTSPRSTAGSRRRRRAACSRDIRWSISSPSATTAATTPWIRTKRRSRWPASWRSRPSRRSAGRRCSSRWRWSR